MPVEDDEDDVEPAPTPRVAAPAPAPRASDVIAELWREREAAAHARMAAPPAPPVPPRPRAGAGISSGLPIPRAAAAVIAAALVLGGGAGVFFATRSGGPSFRTFVARAEGICGRGNAPVSALTKPTNYPELSTAGATVATATSGQVTELRRLEAPSSHASDVRNLFTAMDATSVAAKSLADAADKKDDAATATATKQLKMEYDAASTEAKVAGFSTCVTGMSIGMGDVLGGSQAVVKTGFLAKADAICRAGARQFADVADPRNDSARELARYLSEGLAIANNLQNQLKALPVPPGDEATVADMLTAQDNVDAKVREMRDAVQNGDESTFAAASHELDQLSTQANAKFDAYSLGICGSNFGEE